MARSRTAGGHAKLCYDEGVDRRVMTHGPAHSWFDGSRAPIIVMRFPEAVFSDEELAGALHAVQHWMLFQVDAPFGFIADLRHPLRVSAQQRRLLATAEASYRHVDRAYNAGQAVVVANPLARAVIRMVYRMTPPVYPVELVSTLDLALAWLEPFFLRAMTEFPDGPVWCRRRPAA
jgi:hypothetical protein